MPADLDERLRRARRPEPRTGGTRRAPWVGSAHGSADAGPAGGSPSAAWRPRSWWPGASPLASPPPCPVGRSSTRRRRIDGGQHSAARRRAGARCVPVQVGGRPAACVAAVLPRWRHAVRRDRPARVDGRGRPRPPHRIQTLRAGAGSSVEVLLPDLAGPSWSSVTLRPASATARATRALPAQLRPAAGARSSSSTTPRPGAFVLVADGRPRPAPSVRAAGSGSCRAVVGGVVRQPRQKEARDDREPTLPDAEARRVRVGRPVGVGVAVPWSPRPPSPSRSCRRRRRPRRPAQDAGVRRRSSRCRAAGRPRGAPTRSTFQAEVDVTALERRRAPSPRTTRHRGRRSSGGRGGGVAAKDVQTTDLTINPDYTTTSDGQTVIDGYDVSNSVDDHRDRKLGSAGAVIDAATAAGGNALSIDSLSFERPDPRTLEDRGPARRGAPGGRPRRRHGRAAGQRLGVGRAR